MAWETGYALDTDLTHMKHNFNAVTERASLHNFDLSKGVPPVLALNGIQALV